MARCSPAPEGFFSHFRPRGKLACDGYIMKHVWISALLRGGARRIKRRLAGSIWHGIAFRLRETSRSIATPQNIFQILINSYNFLFFFVLFVKKWPATRPVLHRLLFLSPALSSCSSRSRSSRSSSPSTMAAAGWSNITSAERPLSRGGEQGAGRDLSCAKMVPVLSIDMPCRPRI